MTVAPIIEHVEKCIAAVPVKTPGHCGIIIPVPGYSGYRYRGS